LKVSRETFDALSLSNIDIYLRQSDTAAADLGGTLPLVIGRMGHAARLRAPEQPLPSARARGGRIHVDCASLGPQALELAVAAFGADKIVIGTDCPIFRADWTLEAVRKARISDEDRRAILRENAKKLLYHLRTN